MGERASRVTGLGVLVFSVAVSGCATLRNALNFEEPQIELQEIHVTGMVWSWQARTSGKPL